MALVLDLVKNNCRCFINKLYCLPMRRDKDLMGMQEVFLLLFV